MKGVDKTNHQIIALFNRFSIKWCFYDLDLKSRKNGFKKN
jgi:hypothetical protein